jgi:hypothetical protein
MTAPPLSGKELFVCLLVFGLAVLATCALVAA